VRLLTQPEYDQAIPTFHKTDSLLFDWFSDDSTLLAIYGSLMHVIKAYGGEHRHSSTHTEPEEYMKVVSLMPQTSRTNPPLPVL